MQTHCTRLRADSRGAVFVEKLIVYLPLLLTFFLGWELAELGAASIVVQRASAAAGRAAVVVLPDDPSFYDGEDVGSYSGRRRDDIELAAGMVLSAIPHLTSEFTVDVSDPPQTVGPIDVTLTASYQCGTVSIICGSDETLELSSTTRHTYHGAKYAYSMMGGLGGSTGALLGEGGGYRRGSRDDDAEHGDSGYRGGPRPGGGGGGGGGGTPFVGCGKGNGAAAYGDRPYDNPGTTFGNPLGQSYGKGGISAEAVRYRCEQAKTKSLGGKNVAVISFKCGNNPKVCTVAGHSKSITTHSEHDVLSEFNAIKAKNPSCEIVELYTEREPCDDGPKCSNMLPGAGLRPDQVKYSFSYNPKRSVDVSNNAYYKDKRAACTKFKEQYKQWEKNNRNTDKNCKPINANPDSCSEIERWARQNGKANDPKVKDCLEFLQAKEDFEDSGPRKEYEKDTLEAFKNAEKNCKNLPPSSFGAPDDCTTKDDATRLAEIEKEIAKHQRYIDQLEGRAEPKIFVNDAERARRIADRKAKIAALEKERTALKGKGKDPDAMDLDP